MNKKEPQIFSISDFEIEEKEFLHINSLIKDGNFKEALKSSKEAIFKYPGNSAFFILQSFAYSFDMKNDEAISILKVAEKKFPIDDQVQYQLAKIYYIMGKYGEAEKYFKKSYKLISEDDIIVRSDCLNGLGILYVKINKRNKAVEQFELALTEYPNNMNARNNLRKFSNSKNLSIPNKSPINQKDPFDNSMNNIDENLSFLPPDSSLLLPFLELFLNEAGISSGRVEEISSGEKPTEEEEGILLCSFDVATILIDVIMEEGEDNNNDVKKQLFEDALDIASEYVPKVKGRAMILQIKDELKEILDMTGSSNYDE